MSGVRGSSKAPGEYRRIQNWIGAPACTEETARFVPIAPQLLPDAMSDLEKYIHSDAPDRLVQLAVIHAEFESLHPFLDGNGRLGRMIIPLFLVEKKLLSSPNFFVSAYFEQDRPAYYDALLSVSATGDWTPWCRYFLTALTAQAQENETRARSILELYRTMKSRIADLTHSQHAIRTLDFLFQFPTFTGPTFERRSAIPVPTARRILRVLRDQGILQTLREASGRTPSLFSFPQLLRCAEGDFADQE